MLPEETPLGAVPQAEVPQASPLLLRVRSGAGVERDYPLEGDGPIVLGRDPDCGIVLDDPLRYISARHATLVRGEAGVQLADTSRNGTRFDDGTILRSGQVRTLKPGDAFEIGSYRLVLGRDGQPAQAQPIPAPTAEFDLPSMGAGRGFAPASLNTSSPPVFSETAPDAGTDLAALLDDLIIPRGQTPSAFEASPASTPSMPDIQDFVPQQGPLPPFVHAPSAPPPHESGGVEDAEGGLPPFLAEKPPVEDVLPPQEESRAPVDAFVFLPVAGDALTTTDSDHVRSRPEDDAPFHHDSEGTGSGDYGAAVRESCLGLVTQFGELGVAGSGHRSLGILRAVLRGDDVDSIVLADAMRSAFEYLSHVRTEHEAAVTGALHAALEATSPLAFAKRWASHVRRSLFRSRNSSLWALYSKMEEETFAQAEVVFHKRLLDRPVDLVPPEPQASGSVPPKGNRRDPRLFSAILLAGLTVSLTGCGGPDPTRIKLSVTTTAQINRNTEGVPSPVVMRVFDLRTREPFQTSSFDSLYHDSLKTLGASSLGSDEYELPPSWQWSAERVSPPETQYLGVVVAFRVLPGATWRLSVPIRQHRTNKIKLLIGPNSVSQFSPS
ncbi:type VI secretion system lipoprotein TssJ [Acetobacter vaccinii]|uniref:Type VI secretion system lipoprotein TssJ n=1 Tax=Acetobacter vaccinii TaxID=2592655 RepID=A0A5C1YK89_9PROT|nr:type VI secretion system lipoprotein TssJ [Acetobacter vaccinii]QEO16473.1 type VI secretion system lipoprotein TssJ [Acetobacter vaccinii]